MLVTGGGRGIGAALVAGGLARGWEVWASLRDPEALAALPAGARPLRFDVTDRPALARAAADFAGPLDLLVNNAGIIGPARQSPLDMDFEGFAETLAVNSLAPLAVAQAFLPALRRAPAARILTLSSQMAWMGYRKADRIAYRASKAAVNKVMQGLATLLEPEGIAVALVDPGWVRTAMGGPEAEEEPEAVAEGILTLAERLTLAGTGRFYRWSGEERDF